MVRCTQAFQPTKKESVSVFDQAVYPWCICRGDNVLDVFFFTELVYLLVLEMRAAVGHERLGDCVFMEYMLE